MTNDRAVILLSQMYLSQFDNEEKEALTMAIQVLQENNKITTGGLYISLSEVQSMLMDIQKQFYLKEIN